MSEHARVPGRFDSAPFWVMIVILIIAAVVLSQRFIFGLGEVTNLNDGYPWGIWIAIDLIVDIGRVRTGAPPPDQRPHPDLSAEK